jgi:hypothetical protein
MFFIKHRKLLTVSLFVVLLIIFSLFVFRTEISISISHYKNPVVVKFAKGFIKDLNDKDMIQLKPYFLKEKTFKLFKRIKTEVDPQLQNRKYFIGIIHTSKYLDKLRKYVEFPNEPYFFLRTIINNKKERWLWIFLKKNNGKFLIEHFQPHGELMMRIHF